jgi:hypothetical protein
MVERSVRARARTRVVGARLDLTGSTRLRLEVMAPPKRIF